MLTNWLRRAGCPHDRASTYYMMIEARLLDSRREFTKSLVEKLIHTLQKMMILNMMIMTERLIHTLKEVLFVLLISMAVSGGNINKKVNKDDKGLTKFVITPALLFEAKDSTRQ